MDRAEPKWPNGLQRCAHRTDGRGVEPRTLTNACGQVCKFVDQKGSAAMLTSIQSVFITPEVNLRITKVRKDAKSSTLALKPRADVTRSPKQGYQWTPEKDLCPPNFF